MKNKEREIELLKAENKFLQEYLERSLEREEGYRIRLMIVIGVYTFTILIQTLVNLFS